MNKGDGDRVCDSCFNKLLSEAKYRQDSVRRARAAAERMAQEGLDDGALQGPTASSKAQATAVLAQSALETLDELNKRGELISAAAEKSDKLANVRLFFRHIIFLINVGKIAHAYLFIRAQRNLIE